MRMHMIQGSMLQPKVGDRLTNIFKKDFLCLDNEHIFGGDQGYTPEITDEILTTARNLELEVNEDDIQSVFFSGIEVSVGITFQDGDRFNSCQVIYSQFGLAIHHE
ncbi:hypothetical protein TNCV_3127181 [Trichonephila clavipes]|nr:hypothetical protein TNCV_3127181 [Trichonephila clavipes]